MRSNVAFYRMIKTLRAAIVAASLAVPAVASSQVDVQPYRAAANQLIQLATRDSSAWGRLAELTDDYGPRMSGSPHLEQAITWIVCEVKRDGLENVHTEPVMVTHWVRGQESAELIAPRRASLHMLGLGRSVG